MSTRAFFFPFDLFGSPGTKAGAELLADACREMLADNQREKMPTRARAYRGKVQCEEFAFEKLGDYENWREQARSLISRTLKKNDFLIWVTGNHLTALPLYEELGRASKKTLVVQLDAHLDIYNLADCTKELSHGNFLMHADGPLPPIVNLGHRELLLTPAHIAKFYRATCSAAEMAIGPAGVLETVRDLCADAERVFLDIDCDVFDPAFFPAVRDARPFGLAPHAVLQILDVVGSERLAGLAISEFDPARDQNDRCLETLMWLIEYVLLMKYEAK